MTIRQPAGRAPAFWEVPRMLVSDPSTRLDQLMTLVSSRVGVIRSLDRIPHGIELPDPPVHYSAVLGHHDFKRGGLHERSASGKGETSEESMVGAICEAVERYCASHPNPDSVVQTPLSTLQEKVFEPSFSILYSESQYASEGFPFRPFDHDMIVSWLPAQSIPEGEKVLVPATFVYMNYPCRGPERYLADPSSNGLATGSDVTTRS